MANMKTGQFLGILSGIVVLTATIFGWGFWVGNRLTTIDDRIGYIERFLKAQYHGRFISTDIDTLEQQVSPLVEASEGEKPTVSTLVNQNPETGSFVVYNRKTHTTDNLGLAPNVETYVYVPTLRRFLRISRSSLPPGAAVATLKAKGGNGVAKIYTIMTWGPQKSPIPEWNSWEPEHVSAGGPTATPSPNGSP